MDKTTKKSTIIKVSIITFSVIFLLAAILLIFCLAIFNKNITVEAGTKSISTSDFISNKYVANNIFSRVDSNKLDLTSIGKYPVKLYMGKLAFSCNVEVVDTTPPTATPKEHSVFKGNSAKPEDFVTDIKDFTDVTVKFKKEPDFTNPGKQDVTLVLTDAAGNRIEISSVLNVTKDSTPPVISGVKNLTVYVGQTINYRKNVVVTDDHDSNPTLTVDSKSVDTSKEGLYTVTYKASDATGNVYETKATVNVIRKPDATEEPTQDINVLALELADKVISSIITDGMTTTQKVEAIYNWARKNIGYSGKSNKSDYKLEAYNAFKNRSGDCYTYFAATKLMFERLAIPNIDVVKVKNYANDSNHYWSLVSVDGGSTYYHFDATPRLGSGDDFCLVTDAFIDAYSDSHSKSHNRDKTLYPATPA